MKKTAPPLVTFCLSPAVHKSRWYRDSSWKWRCLVCNPPIPLSLGKGKRP